MRKVIQNSLLGEKSKIKSMCIFQKQRKKGLKKLYPMLLHFLLTFSIQHKDLFYNPEREKAKSQLLAA